MAPVHVSAQYQSGQCGSGLRSLGADPDPLTAGLSGRTELSGTGHHGFGGQGIAYNETR